MRIFLRVVLYALLALLALVTIFVLVPGLGHVEDPGLEPAFDVASATAPPARSRVPRNADRSAFFGDLHVHTSYSTDAFIFGVRALPDDAYHFAKGGTIAHGAGYPIELSKPLDFLAVTDHAEFLGTARAANPDIPTVRRPLRDLLQNGNRLEITRYWAESAALMIRGGFGAIGANPTASRAAWEDTIASANRHDDPGVFTAFIGYEWSSLGIHRNVVYGSERVPDRPFSSIDSGRPQDLWRALEAQNDAGQPVIAIPHNMNESGGRMYPRDSIEELEWSESEARLRRRIEPVSEIYQIKGSSEAHPKLSPQDPFADFEIIELAPYRGTGGGGPEGSYSRDALRAGLELAMRDGWNPYVLGVIGSSDSHNASSPAEEDRHHGKLPVLDGSAGIRSGEALLIPTSVAPGASWGGGGLAGIWAEENTRASLFAALERRETFATSGPRISVRFFGGWNFSPSVLTAPDVLRRADRDGVPMGGDLSPQDGPAPSFVLWADKDPASGHLDRIQIIKGSVDAEGRSFERIYDVAASGNRARDPETGLFEPVGTTVDVPSASYTNTIGAAHLEGVWIDPDFDPQRDAFYYVRVLEIPTPRMSTHDAKTLGIEAPEPATIQERAATSAIWYTAPR